MNERRKFKRFNPGGEADIFIDFGGMDFLKLKDISRGGISMIYISNSKSPPDSMTIDIFHAAKPLLAIRNIECRTVYDIPELTSNLSYNGLNTRKRGLEFSRLNVEQATSLDAVLKRLAIFLAGSIASHPRPRIR